MNVPAPKGAPSHLATWEVLKRYLEEQIITGAHPLGSSLPSVRELASQVDVNRNTVSKAYQALGREGILTVERGRGVRVIAVPSRDGTAAGRLSASIDLLVEEASLAGLSEEWLLKTVQDSVASAYRRRRVRIGFIECTPPDTQQIAQDLSHHLAVTFEPVDLAEFQRDAVGISHRFDLLTTTLFHLQEVISSLPSSWHDRIVGINHAVSHRSILEVARLRQGSTIVIVGPNERTLERVKSIVLTYAKGTLRTFTPADDEAEVAAALATADVAVDIQTIHDTVRRLAPDIPTITISFHIEQQSMEYLRAAVQHTLAAGATPVL
jgi:GntR family transcriptional regulator